MLKKRHQRLRDSVAFRSLQHLLSSGQHIVAKETVLKLLKRGPGDYELMTVLGQIHYLLSEFKDGVAILEKSICINTRQETAHYYLGLCQMRLNKERDAILSFTHALKLNPKSLDALTNRGNLLRNCGQFEDALQDHNTCVQLSPSRASALNNRGVVNLDLGRSTEAIEDFKAAMAQDAHYPDPHYNLGRVFLAIEDFDQARDAFDQAIHLDARFAPAYLEKANLFYRMEEFETFWSIYDQWRWVGRPDERSHYDQVAPRWTCLTQSGHLLLWAEQGIGDQILFSSLLPEIIKERKITLVVDPRLLPTFRRSFPGITVVGQGEDLSQHGPFDYQGPIGQLGSLLRQTALSFSNAPERFLTPDAERVERYRNLLPSGNGSPRYVGIAWKSNNRDIGIQKSISLDFFDHLVINQDVILINLQYGDTKSERDKFEQRTGHPIYHAEDLDYYEDLDGVIALAACCDDVLTSSNVTAHYAGALGICTRIVKKNGGISLFYWLETKQSLRWYKTVIQFPETKAHLTLSYESGKEIA